MIRPEIVQPTSDVNHAQHTALPESADGHGLKEAVQVVWTSSASICVYTFQVYM